MVLSLLRPQHLEPCTKSRPTYLKLISFLMIHQKPLFRKNSELALPLKRMHRSEFRVTYHGGFAV